GHRGPCGSPCTGRDPHVHDPSVGRAGRDPVPWSSALRGPLLAGGRRARRTSQSLRFTSRWLGVTAATRILFEHLYPFPGFRTDAPHVKLLPSSAEPVDPHVGRTLRG